MCLLSRLQLKENVTTRASEAWTSSLSMMTDFLPDVRLQIRQTSCSSPRAPVPVCPASRAELLGKPKRKRTLRLLAAIVRPVFAAWKSTW